MSTFAFLQNIQLGEDTGKGKKSGSTGGGGPKKQRNPDAADLRLFASGAIFPSTALVEEFKLEYVPKDAAVGQGFDVFQSSQWPLTASMPAFILIGAISKDEGKVDLFDQVRYNNDGDKDNKNSGATPMTSVLEQGSPTFGKILLGWLEEAYGATPNDEGFIDLQIIREHPLNTANGIYNIPKMIARGEKAGELSYERRENMTFFPLAVVTGHVSAPKVEKEVKETPAPTEPAEVPATQPPVEQPQEASAPPAEPAETPEATPVASEGPTEEELLGQPTMNDLWPTEPPPAEDEVPEEQPGQADDPADDALSL